MSKKISFIRDALSQLSSHCPSCDDDLDIIETKEEVEADIQQTQAPAKLDKCVKDVYNQLVKKFKEKYNKNPTEKQNKKFESSAWAICKNQVKSEKSFTREDAYKYLEKITKEKQNG